MIDDFFQRYADAFLTSDSTFIDQAYEFPMTFYTETGDDVSFDKSAFGENTLKLLDIYQRLAIGNIEFNVAEQSEISPALQLVTIIWRFADQADQLVYSATTRYLLRMTDHGPRIKAVFVVDETSKLNRLLSEQQE